MTSKTISESKKNLVIDSSVREDIINELRLRGVIPEIQSIIPFQFKISEEVGGFIKTFQEFYESIKKNDFFENAELLRNQFLRPLLILEEDDSQNLDRNMLLEIWATLFARFNIPIILSRNVKDTVKLLLTIIRRDRERSEKVVRVTTRMSKAPIENPELQRYILRGIPGINEELAGRLLAKFKTFEKLVSTKPEEFMEVKGIGKKLAEKLHSVFTSLYYSDQGKIEKGI